MARGGSSERVADGAERRALAPTRYLTALRDLLKETEPELWTFFSQAAVQDSLVEEARQQLLRTAYRLDAESQPELFAAAEAAAGRLEITDPVTLYQAQDGAVDGANAHVVSLPDEVHVVFSGRLLELLDGAELVAVLGHELAHHRLWSEADGELWVLDRLVHASAADLAASPCHIETARLVRLHTELFADRGALVAADGDLVAAVACLVKVATGLRSVSGAAYLQQAAEVIAGGPEASAGISHPEVFVRAWALQRWSEDGSSVDAEVAERLVGPADLENLDVLAQRQVSDQVAAVIRRFLSPEWARTDALLGHASLFGDHAVPAAAGPAARKDPAHAPLPPVAVGLVDLFAYVLLDLATVDEEVEAPGLASALLLSDELGFAKRFDAIVAKELSLPVKEVRRRRSTAREVLAEAVPS